jgi:hypothetical protein
MNEAQKRYLKRSALGAVILFAVYITVMTLANSFAVALGELERWWVYVTALSTGFGLQVGLYMHTRDLAKAGAVGFQGSRMAVGGGVSATSMVVCCLHHVTDVLPLVGFSAATLFLADYQSVFMSLGVLSSIVGIIMMLEQLQSARAVGILSSRLGRLLAWYDVAKIRKVSFAASSLIFVVLLAGALGSQGVNAAPDSSTVVGSEAGVTFTIKPVDYDDAIGFQIKIDTHQGALSFDLTEVSTLVVGNTAYEPLSWEGSSPGGHHRSGELVFPKPVPDADSAGQDRLHDTRHRHELQQPQRTEGRGRRPRFHGDLVWPLQGCNAGPCFPIQRHRRSVRDDLNHR